MNFNKFVEIAFSSGDFENSKTFNDHILTTIYKYEIDGWMYLGQTYKLPEDQIVLKFGMEE